MSYSVNLNNSNDTPLALRKVKLKNKNKLVLQHLNANLLARKFDQLKVLIENLI